MPRCRVALTFDAEHPDRPDRRRVTSGCSRRAGHGADRRATFFIQGRWAEAYPATARRIADGGPPGRQPLPLPRPDAAALRRRASRRTSRDAEARSIEARRGRPAAVVPLPVRGRSDGPAGARPRSRPPATGTSAGTSTPRTGSRAGTAEAHRRTTSSTGCSRTGDGAVVLLHTWPDVTLDALPGDRRAPARRRGRRSSGSTSSTRPGRPDWA